MSGPTGLHQEPPPHKSQTRKAVIACLVACGLVVTYAALRSQSREKRHVAATSLPAFELRLTGAVLVADDTGTARTIATSVWKSRADGTYLTLSVSGAESPGDAAPVGEGNSVPSPPLQFDGPMAFVESTSLGHPVVRMSWRRPEGVVWLLAAHGVSGRTPSVERLAHWALALRRASDAARGDQYILDDSTMSRIAADTDGMRMTRTFVWHLEGEDVGMLVIEATSASTLANLLDSGTPQRASVGSREWDLVSPTRENSVVARTTVASQNGTTAVVNVPAPLAARASDILAALRLVG